MTFYKPSMNDGRHVLVFGSNLAGRHGAGAALEAKKYWLAESGAAFGKTGHAYAIPTKDSQPRKLPLPEINDYVSAFVDYANACPDLTFLVTAIGTGLAGYSHAEISPMFRDAPSNCVLPDEWKNATA